MNGRGKGVRSHSRASGTLYASRPAQGPKCGGKRTSAPGARSATFHGIVRLNGLEPQQVRQELERKWGGAKQVDVAPFEPEKDEKANIGDIINYALKHQCRTHLGAAEERWPDEWIAEYFAFLHEWSRGFQKLKVSVGRQRKCDVGVEIDGDVVAVVHDQLVEGEHGSDEVGVDPLPFSCSFSVFDNYYCCDREKYVWNKLE